MSRIGKLPVHIPAGVTVAVNNNVVTVKGPKGELKQEINPNITVTDIFVLTLGKIVSTNLFNCPTLNDFAFVSIASITVLILSVLL